MRKQFSCLFFGTILASGNIFAQAPSLSFDGFSCKGEIHHPAQPNTTQGVYVLGFSNPSSGMGTHLEFYNASPTGGMGESLGSGFMDNKQNLTVELGTSGEMIGKLEIVSESEGKFELSEMAPMKHPDRIGRISGKMFCSKTYPAKLSF